jgi:Dolichyl-phosphate-mannose-protein mannosyltransferase
VIRPLTAIDDRPLTLTGKAFFIGSLLVGVLVVHLAVDAASEPFFNSDETRHIMMGVFFRDLFQDLPISHLKDYSIRYYLQYPALSLLIWPPLFHAVEGVVMLLLGCSVWAAKLALALFVALACGYLFLLVARTHDAWTAAIAVLIFALCPLVFSYSRQVMLEMPTLACALAATYYFLRYLDGDRRRDLVLAALAAALSALVKFDAMYLLVLFLLMLAMRGRLKLLVRRETIAAALLALALVLPVYVLMIKEVGSGHFRSIEAGNDVSSGFFDPKNLLFYASCLPGQIGWVAVVFSWIGIAAAIRGGIARTSVYAAMVIATLFTFAFFGIVEARHAIYWIPAFALFAAQGVQFVSQWLGIWARLVMGGFVVCATFWTTWQTPVPYVRGYEQAARYIVDHNRDSPFCLIDTYLEGTLVYYVRLHDPDRRLWVLRADKLFYSVMSDPRYAYVEHVQGKDALLAEIFRYDPELLLIEEPRVGPTLPMADFFRSVIHEHPERFRLEASIPIETNQPTFARVKLNIYRNLLRNPASDHQVNIDMLWLRRRLQASAP